MYAGVPSSPAWQRLAAIAPAALLRRPDASALLTAANQEASRQRLDAQQRGDTAALAELTERLRRIGTLRAQWQGQGAAQGFVDVQRAAEASAFGLNLGGAVLTPLLLVGGAVLAWPFLRDALGTHRARRSW